MKYGESIFDIFYLLTAIVTGILILKKAKGNTGRLMGAACATFPLSPLEAW